MEPLQTQQGTTKESKDDLIPPYFAIIVAVILVTVVLAAIIEVCFGVKSRFKRFNDNRIGVERHGQSTAPRYEYHLRSGGGRRAPRPAAANCHIYETGAKTGRSERDTPSIKVGRFDRYTRASKVPEENIAPVANPHGRQQESGTMSITPRLEYKTQRRSTDSTESIALPPPAYSSFENRHALPLPDYFAQVSSNIDEVQAGDRAVIRRVGESDADYCLRYERENGRL